jgi:hypothetical protein
LGLSPVGMWGGGGWGSIALAFSSKPNEGLFESYEVLA